MKKTIGILSLVLVLVMCLAFLPGLQTEAEAATASSITVNGYNLPSGYYLPTATWTKTTTKPSGSYFYYSGGTLTIYNVTLTCSSGTRAVYAEGDLIVSLSGTSKLTTTDANGIRSTGTLKFTGSGSLTLSSSGYDAIYSSGDMEFAQTGTVTATATGHTSSGVECAAKLTIGGNLNATSESSYAIYASGDISMTKGTVNATGNCTFSAGGIRSNGAITVSGGTLNVTSKSDGISSKYDFWQKAGNVTVNADWNGIVVETATNNVIIHEGTMTVTAARNGLKAQKFYMNGGHGYIKSTNTSYDSSYSAVELAGNTSSYYVQKGNVNSYGVTTTSSSALTKLVYANLSTYDYVYFTGYITVNGVELRDGYYLPSGKTTADTTKPSGGYAHYSGNTLTLNNYQGSNNSASGIDSRYDLNIVLTQGSVNKLTTSAASGTSYRGINVSGTLNIRGLGQLTITGGQYAIYSTGSMTLSTTQVIAIGGGIYSGGNMTLSSASVGVYQLLSAASGTHAIQAAGDIDIDGAAGAVYINTPDKVNGNFVRGIVGKNITINSSVGVTSSGVGIRGEGNVTINGGMVEVNAKLGSGIYAAGTMKITGGTVDVTAYNNGLAANKLVVTGGDITAVSTYTGNDAANKAIEVADNTTTYFQIPSDYAFLASTGTTSSYNVGNVNDLGTYDWVRIGDFVELHGVELRSGYYLASGNSANTPTLVKPSSGDYAYYEDGVLTLCDYEYSGKAMAIRAFADLTVEMTGGSKINHIMSHAGDLTFKGTGALEIKRNMANDAVNVIGNVYVQNGLLTINGSGGNGIECNHFYLNNGKVWVTANFNGITVKNGLTVNGGVLIAKSTGTTNDTLYSAINPTTNSPTISIKSGLNHMVGTTSAEDTRLATNFASGDYDFAALGDFVMVQGQILTYGNYMKSGTKTPIQNSVADGYAYYAGNNRLILKNYSNSGTECGIASSVNLTIVLDGSSTLDSKNKSVSQGGGSYEIICYEAIKIWGDLTIEGRTSATDSLTAKSQEGEAIFADGKLTVKGDRITATSGGSWVVYVDDFSLTGGTLNVTSTSTALDSSAYAMSAVNSLNVTGGTLNVTASKNNGISVNRGSMTVSGGIVNVTALGGKGIVIDYHNLTISGGEMIVTALEHAIELKQERVNISGGFLVASSTSTNKDSSYYALKLPGTSSSYYNVASSLSQAASLSGTKTALEKLDNSKLSGYDYIQIGKYIEIAGNTVKSGYSIKSDGTIVSGNAGTGSAYYVSEYAGNTLTLNNLIYTTGFSARGIEAFSDVTIKVTGNSAITTGGYHGIFATGNVAFTGTKALTVTSGSGYGLKAIGNVTVSGVTLTLNSSSTTALHTDGDVTVNSGFLKAFGYHNGIYADKVDIKGGNLIANSSFDGTDSNYYAVNSAFTYASDLYVAGSARSGVTGMEIYDSAKHRDYDYIYVGDFVLIGGTFLPDGYFLSTGSTTPTASVSGSNYAYYSGGALFLVNYTNSGTNGIKVPHDLKLIMTGTNSYTATSSTALYVIGDLTVSGTGSLTVSGAYNGVFANAFIPKDGKFTAISTNAASDSVFKALSVSSVNLTNIPSHVKLGNTDSTAIGAVLYNDTNRNNYDYVSFEPLVISIGGIEIGDGDYLLPGATNTTEVLPSGTTAYAQRVGNKLNLVNFTYTGTTACGIDCNGSLNLVVMGTNKLTVGNNYGIDVALDLIISGTGKLTITGDDTCIYAGAGCTTGASTLKLTSNSRNGIQVLYGNFTMNGGVLDIYAKNDGINAEKVTINGGTALIKSNNMTSDSNYSSIWTDSFSVASGLRVLGSTDPTGFVATDIDVSKLRTYDYIKVQAGTAPPVGVTVSGTVTSYLTSGTVTIKLYKSGSTTAAYTTTITGANGSATSFSISGVAAGTYTMEVSKANHVTREYTITVGSSNVTQEAKICPIGDVTGDGKVNMKDWNRLYDHVNEVSSLSGYNLQCADVTGDGKVNMKDWNRLYAHVNEVNPLW